MGKPVEDVDEETGEKFKHIKSRPMDFSGSDFEHYPEQSLSLLIAHEIGHSIGFPHSSYVDSIMYNKPTGDQIWNDRKPELNNFEDKSKVRHNYGVRNGRRKVGMDPVCKHVLDEGKDYACFNFQEKTELKCDNEDDN